MRRGRALRNCWRGYELWRDVTGMLDPTYRHLYGPVPSRRLGRSLGINMVPHKTCCFDCIYCQLGPTTNHTMQVEESGRSLCLLI